jgi:cellulose synthase/poly-beta-1,6-N-acetylglucosamine synthase-like glycosyltransferase
MPGVRAVTNAAHRYGVVAIGRNEGERLRACLESLDPTRAPLVYVDSDSTDDSVALAAAMGAEVVRLDLSTPFTAARARNEGFDRLQRIAPEIEFVQFVDGDCEVMAGWLDAAMAHLDAHPGVVAVFGRRSERFPQRSIYNRLCDLDWRSTPGEVRSFGGDVMLRATALRHVGGYNPALIAGEEPELSIRVRRAGGRIWHLDRPMTLHDANMLRLGQWWKRGVRTGYAYAEGAAMNGAPPERHWVRETQRACAWGLVLPVLVMTSLLGPAWLTLLLLLLYPLQWLRLWQRSTLEPDVASAHAASQIVGKFAEALGVLKYALARLRGQRVRLIEYK